MSIWQWKRWDTVQRVMSGLMTNAEGARVLGRSARQLRRVRARVAQLGKQAYCTATAGAHRPIEWRRRFG